MTKSTKKTAIKSISFFLAFTFLLSDVFYAAPIESLQLRNIHESALEVILRDPARLEIPREFAALKDVYSASAKGTAPLLIHIQDAHANLSGQENLAKTLDAIMSKYDVRLVLVEGGTQDVTLTRIKSAAPREVWKIVARKYLIEGKISGEEYLNLTSNHPMKIMGIEDKTLYDRSLAAYAGLADKRENILQYLKTIQYGLEKLKKKFYPEELLKYEKNSNIVSLISLTQGNDLNLFPNIQKIIAIQAKERLIDFSLANPEQAAYKDYINEFSNLNLEEILNEMESVTEKTYQKSLKGDAFIIHSIDRYVKLLSSAYNIQMSSTEFKLFETNEPDFPTVPYLAFMNRKLAELGYFEDLVSYENILDQGKEALKKFYESVDQRDYAFMRNIEKEVKGAQVAVLIAGGYHTTHLKELFKEKGYSYAVLAPIVSSETNQSKYEKLLLEPLVSSSTLRMQPAAEAMSGSRLAEIVDYARSLAAGSGARLSRVRKASQHHSKRQSISDSDYEWLSKRLATAQFEQAAIDAEKLVPQGLTAFYNRLSEHAILLGRILRKFERVGNQFRPGQSYEIKTQLAKAYLDLVMSYVKAVDLAEEVKNNSEQVRFLEAALEHLNTIFGLLSLDDIQKDEGKAAGDLKEELKEWHTALRVSLRQLKQKRDALTASRLTLNGSRAASSPPKRFSRRELLVSGLASAAGISVFSKIILSFYDNQETNAHSIYGYAIPSLSIGPYQVGEMIKVVEKAQRLSREPLSVVDDFHLAPESVALLKVILETKRPLNEILQRLRGTKRQVSVFFIRSFAEVFGKKFSEADEQSIQIYRLAAAAISPGLAKGVEKYWNGLQNLTLKDDRYKAILEMSRQFFSPAGAFVSYGESVRKQKDNTSQLVLFYDLYLTRDTDNGEGVVLLNYSKGKPVLVLLADNITRNMRLLGTHTPYTSTVVVALNTISEVMQSSSRQNETDYLTEFQKRFYPNEWSLNEKVLNSLQTTLFALLQKQRNENAKNLDKRSSNRTTDHELAHVLNEIRNFDLENERQNREETSADLSAMASREKEIFEKLIYDSLEVLGGLAIEGGAKSDAPKRSNYRFEAAQTIDWLHDEVVQGFPAIRSIESLGPRAHLLDLKLKKLMQLTESELRLIAQKAFRRHFGYEPPILETQTVSYPLRQILSEKGPRYAKFEWPWKAIVGGVLLFSAASWGAYQWRKMNREKNERIAFYVKEIDTHLIESEVRQVLGPSDLQTLALILVENRLKGMTVPALLTLLNKKRNPRLTSNEATPLLKALRRVQGARMTHGPIVRWLKSLILTAVIGLSPLLEILAGEDKDYAQNVLLVNNFGFYEQAKEIEEKRIPLRVRDWWDVSAPKVPKPGVETILATTEFPEAERVMRLLSIARSQSEETYLRFLPWVLMNPDNDVFEKVVTDFFNSHPDLRDLGPYHSVLSLMAWKHRDPKRMEKFLDALLKAKALSVNETFFYYLKPASLTYVGNNNLWVIRKFFEAISKDKIPISDGDLRQLLQASDLYSVRMAIKIMKELNRPISLQFLQGFSDKAYRDAGWKTEDFKKPLDQLPIRQLIGLNVKPEQALVDAVWKQLPMNDTQRSRLEPAQTAIFHFLQDHPEIASSIRKLEAMLHFFELVQNTQREEVVMDATSRVLVALNSELDSNSTPQFDDKPFKELFKELGMPNPESPNRFFKGVSQKTNFLSAVSEQVSSKKPGTVVLVTSGHGLKDVFLMENGQPGQGSINYFDYADAILNGFEGKEKNVSLANVWIILLHCHSYDFAKDNLMAALKEVAKIKGLTITKDLHIIGESSRDSIAWSSVFLPYLHRDRVWNTTEGDIRIKHLMKLDREENNDKVHDLFLIGPLEMTPEISRLIKEMGIKGPPLKWLEFGARMGEQQTENRGEKAEDGSDRNIIQETIWHVAREVAQKYDLRIIESELFLTEKLEYKIFGWLYKRIRHSKYWRKVYARTLHHLETVIRGEDIIRERWELYRFVKREVLYDELMPEVFRLAWRLKWADGLRVHVKTPQLLSDKLALFHLNFVRQRIGQPRHIPNRKEQTEILRLMEIMPGSNGARLSSREEITDQLLSAALKKIESDFAILKQSPTLDFNEYTLRLKEIWKSFRSAVWGKDAEDTVRKTNNSSISSQMLIYSKGADLFVQNTLKRALLDSPLAAGHVSVLAMGSNARYELTTASDMDYTLLTNVRFTEERTDSMMPVLNELQQAVLKVRNEVEDALNGSDFAKHGKRDVLRIHTGDDFISMIADIHHMDQWPDQKQQEILESITKIMDLRHVGGNEDMSKGILQRIHESILRNGGESSSVRQKIASLLVRRWSQRYLEEGKLTGLHGTNPKDIKPVLRYYHYLNWMAMLGHQSMESLLGEEKAQKLKSAFLTVQVARVRWHALKNSAQDITEANAEITSVLGTDLSWRQAYGIHADQGLESAAPAIIMKQYLDAVDELFETSKAAVLKAIKELIPSKVLTSKSLPFHHFHHLAYLGKTCEVVRSLGYHFSMERGIFYGEADEIRLKSPSESPFLKDPAASLEIVEASAELGIPLDSTLVEKIREASPLVQIKAESTEKNTKGRGFLATELRYLSLIRFRNRINHAFLNILRMDKDISEPIKMLHRVRLLEAVIPEYRLVTNIDKQNRFHRHTVDWHMLDALTVFEQIPRVSDEEADKEENVIEKAALLARRGKHLQTIRLAILLHDIGEPFWKYAPNKSHDDLGAHELAPRVLTRLGFSENNLESLLIRWLIANDTLLSSTAFRTEILSHGADGQFKIDPKLLAVIQQARDGRDSHGWGLAAKLKKFGQDYWKVSAYLLILLSYADEASVDPGQKRFGNVRRDPRSLGFVLKYLLSESSDSSVSIDERLKLLRKEAWEKQRTRIGSELLKKFGEEISAGESQTWLEQYHEMVPMTLWLDRPPAHIAEEVCLLGRIQKEQKTADVIIRPIRGYPGLCEVIIATFQDAPGIMARMTAVESAYGDIQVAQMNSAGPRGSALNRFLVQFENGTNQADLENSFRSDLLKAFEASPDGLDKTFKEIFGNQNKNYEFLNQDPGPVRVDIYAADGDDSMNLEIESNDFPGLLHIVSRILAEVFGINIQAATVDTLGNRAIDVIRIDYQGHAPSKAMQEDIKRVLQFVLNLRVISPKKLIPAIKLVLAIRNDLTSAKVPEVRIEHLRRLASLRETAQVVLSEIIALSRDKKSTVVRAEAIKTLGIIGVPDKRVIDTLEFRAQDPDIAVKGLAVEVLKELKAKVPKKARGARLANNTSMARTFIEGKLASIDAAKKKALDTVILGYDNPRAAQVLRFALSMRDEKREKTGASRNAEISLLTAIHQEILGAVSLDLSNLGISHDYSLYPYVKDVLAKADAWPSIEQRLQTLESPQGKEDALAKVILVHRKKVEEKRRILDIAIKSIDPGFDIIPLIQRIEDLEALGSEKLYWLIEEYSERPEGLDTNKFLNDGAESAIHDYWVFFSGIRLRTSGLVSLRIGLQAAQARQALTLIEQNQDTAPEILAKQILGGARTGDSTDYVLVKHRVGELILQEKFADAAQFLRESQARHSDLSGTYWFDSLLETSEHMALIERERKDYWTGRELEGLIGRFKNFDPSNGVLYPSFGNGEGAFDIAAVLAEGSKKHTALVSINTNTIGVTLALLEEAKKRAYTVIVVLQDLGELYSPLYIVSRKPEIAEGIRALYKEYESREADDAFHTRLGGLLGYPEEEIQKFVNPNPAARVATEHFLSESFHFAKTTNDVDHFLDRLQPSEEWMIKQTAASRVSHRGITVFQPFVLLAENGLPMTVLLPITSGAGVVTVGDRRFSDNELLAVRRERDKMSRETAQAEKPARDIARRLKEVDERSQEALSQTVQELDEKTSVVVLIGLVGQNRNSILKAVQVIRRELEHSKLKVYFEFLDGHGRKIKSFRMFSPDSTENLSSMTPTIYVGSLDARLFNKAKAKSAGFFALSKARTGSGAINVIPGKAAIRAAILVAISEPQNVKVQGLVRSLTGARLVSSAEIRMIKNPKAAGAKLLDYIALNLIVKPIGLLDRALYSIYLKLKTSDISV